MSYNISVCSPNSYTCHVCNTEHDISEYQYKNDHFDWTLDLDKFFKNYLNIEPYLEDFGIDKDEYIKENNLKGLECLNGLKGWQAYPIIIDGLLRILKDRGSFHDQYIPVFDEIYIPGNKFNAVVDGIKLLNEMANTAVARRNCIFKVG